MADWKSRAKDVTTEYTAPTESTDSSWKKRAKSEDPLMVGTEAPGRLESFARGGAQAATLGFADELAGAGEAGIEAIKGGAPRSFEQLAKAYEKYKEDYQKYRDESRANFKAAEEANPYTYMGGQIAGGIAPTVALGGIGAGIKGAGLVGGVAGLGTSGTDLTGDVSASDKLKEAGMDVVLGGALGAGAASIPAVASYIKNKTLPGKLFSRELSGERVVGQDARRDIGKELVETARTIAKDVQKAMDEAAKNKTDIIDELVKSGKKYDIADLQEALKLGTKELDTSFTAEGDAARRAINEPFKRAEALKNPVKEVDSELQDLFSGIYGQADLENIPTKQLMKTELDAKELNSFRRALGRLGYEKDLKDDQVIALAERLSGKSADKLNKTLNEETGELVENELGEVNSKIKNLIKAQEVFNLGGKATDELGQEKALTPLIQRLEADSTASDIARSQVEKGFAALEKADSTLEKQLKEKAMDIAERFDMSRDANLPLTASREGARKLAMTIPGYAARGLNALNENFGGVGTDINKFVAKPVASFLSKQAGSLATQLNPFGLTNPNSDIENAGQVEKKKFSDMSPDQMLEIAARLKGKGLNGVAKKLETAAQSEDPVQKAQAEFVIKQTPAARRSVENPDEDEQK